MDATIASIPKRGRDRGLRQTTARVLERLQRLASSGVLAGTSSKVLHALGDDRYWLELIGKLEDVDDWRTVAEIVKFHQMQRDGRPAQQINVTSFGVNVTTTEIDSARAIVREIAGLSDSKQTPLTVNATAPLMLSGDEGGKKDGER